ncbi:hypothetical protein NIES806_07530 [Dolichospermum compactum NIES-806]|uniref:Uncharacterized protein n=1 Tax=Dolichospermum compactum NIES-806 TaxID=1973481 RepID=A0A1Z4UZF9_9CYAN|nr:hypothetical protein NIES806_07530 [Dolichospermum compactum NIES-806]
MGNEIFRDRLNRKIEKFILEAQDCIKLEHNGMAGNVRKILV